MNDQMIETYLKAMLQAEGLYRTPEAEEFYSVLLTKSEVQLLRRALTCWLVESRYISAGSEQAKRLRMRLELAEKHPHVVQAPWFALHLTRTEGV